VSARGTVVIGRAVTHGQALPLGIDDPVIAARAVRRALADAGRRAVDVTALVVASPDPIPGDVLAAFARRALGPWGADVPSAVVTAVGDADELAAVAAAELPAVTSDPVAVGIVVGLAADGTTVALCLGRAAGSSKRA